MQEHLRGQILWSAAESMHHLLLALLPGRRRDGPTPTYGGGAARATFEYFGWEETRGDDWDLLWTGRGQYDFMRRAGVRPPSLPIPCHRTKAG